MGWNQGVAFVTGEQTPSLTYSWGVLFDLPPAFEPVARGTASKKFIVRTWALTDGDEIAVADSRPVTLFTARKLEVRARKSDCLDVEVFAADEVPPMPTDAKQIRLLVGMQITTEPDNLFDLMRSRAREAREEEIPDRPVAVERK